MTIDEHVSRLVQFPGVSPIFRGLNYFLFLFRFICTITDLYSKFVYAVPVRSQSVTVVSNAILEYIYLYGPPQRFLLDKRKEYVAEVNCLY